MLRRHFTSYLQSNNDSGGVPGFVDLGLSVMWAECNVGADNPEDSGGSYTWESTVGYTTYPDENLRCIINPRIPTYNQILELYQKTTRTTILVDGIACVKFTADNGNSIIIPKKNMWMKDIHLGTGGQTAYASTWDGDNTYDNNTLQSTLLPHRCVCDYPPKEGLYLSKNVVTNIDSSNMYFAVSTDMMEGNASNALATILIGSTFTFYSNEHITMNLYTTYEKVDDSEKSTLVLSRKSFFKDENIQEIQLSCEELWGFNSYPHCYIEFIISNPCQCIYTDWIPSVCAGRSTLITSGVSQSIKSQWGNTIYRLRYEDWKGYDLTINWTGNSTLPTYIADTCVFFLSSSESEVVYYANIRKKSSVNITADVVDSWAGRVDVDGFLYVRFNPTNAGKVTFVSSKPVE